jgi:hypothetical protein
MNTDQMARSLIKRGLATYLILDRHRRIDSDGRAQGVES